MKEDLLKIIDKFSNARILVIGDIILDKYIIGKTERISPEAPVPVVEFVEEYCVLGGAANVANNLGYIGAQVSLAGVVGNDDNAAKIFGVLLDEGLDERACVLHDPSRFTTLKTRIISEGQQVVRVDKESRHSISEEIADKISSFLLSKIDKLDGIIISDYGKGVICERLMFNIKQILKLGNVISVVDPKISHLSLYKNFTAITPNSKEALALTNKTSIIEAGEFFLKKMGILNVLITKGKEGMVLFRKNKGSLCIHTAAKSVYDVSGAGDTVIACFTAALAAGANPYQAAILANYAAGIVVGKIGTATCSKSELIEGVSYG